MIHFHGSDFYLDASDIEPDLLEALLDCGASGDATDAVNYVLENFQITGNPDDCRKYLSTYGAWCDEELTDHQTNLERLVWLAGCDLRESNEIYLSTY